MGKRIARLIEGHVLRQLQWQCLAGQGNDATSLTVNHGNWAAPITLPGSAPVTQAELDWAVSREWAHTGDDFLWRRTKLGLRLDAGQAAAVDAYIRSAGAGH